MKKAPEGAFFIEPVRPPSENVADADAHVGAVLVQAGFACVIQVAQCQVLDVGVVDRAVDLGTLGQRVLSQGHQGVALALLVGQARNFVLRTRVVASASQGQGRGHVVGQASVPDVGLERAADGGPGNRLLP